MSKSIVRYVSVQSQKIYQAIPWTPKYASPVAWYDASDASTITINPLIANSVSQIDDKSGNDYHLTQSNGSVQPEWGIEEINGLYALNYSSTSDQMFKDSIPDIDLTQFAMITVVEGRLGDWPACGALFKTDNTDTLDFRMQSDLTAGRINAALKLDNVAQSSLTTAYDASMAEYTPNMASLWYDGTDVVVRSDGGLVSATINVDDSKTFTVNRIQIGRQSNTPRNLQGELVILNTSDLTTIQKVEGYLAWKWNLQSKLPGGHPYKSLPPYVE